MPFGTIIAKKSSTKPSAGFFWLVALAALAIQGAISLLPFGQAQILAQNRVNLEREGYPMAFLNGSRVVTFDRQPSRILALGLGASELLVELGLANLVVGRTSKWPEEIALPKYAQELSKIPQINYDKILDAETANDGPDFVYGSFTSATPDPAFVKSYHILATNKNQFFGEVRDLGKLFKVEDRALAFLKDQEKRLSDLSSKLSDADPIDVLVIWNITDDSLVTSGGTDFITEMIQLAGGRNIFSDQGPSPTSTNAQAAALNPNFILIVDDGLTPLSDKILALKGDPVLSLLPAVSDNRLMTLHEAYLLPGPRIADCVELLAKKFHPSLIH
jgi:iron complex transport system substrate-binding protein